MLFRVFSDIKKSSWITTFLAPLVGLGTPRPKKSPPDSFCLTLFGTSFSSPTILKAKKKSIFVDFFILAPLVGLEPTTYRLTAERSTNWAKEEYIKSSDYLCFQEGNLQVFSALKSLTAVFGMGTGVASSLSSLEN